MQPDEKSHKMDHWTFTKCPICLLLAGLNWHTLIYHPSLDLAAAVHIFLFENLRLFEVLKF